MEPVWFAFVCTLAIYREVSDQFPLVVAANRDEFLGRASESPRLLPDRPDVIAGRDLEASGTWLGCRVDGGFLVAGLLNRRSSDGVAGSPAGATRQPGASRGPEQATRPG